MNFSTPTEKVKELIAILDPYANLWGEWISSGACFLSPDEIKIIQNFLLTGSHYESSKELNISLVTAVSRLNKIKRRLLWYQPKYQRWLTERLLVHHGIITYTSKLDYFLNSPFQFLPMPLNLKKKLSLFIVETMKELLDNYSEEDLRKYRSVGDKIIENLKEYLSENKCLHLLRKAN